MVGLVGAMVSFADGHELLELAGVEVEAKQAEADFRRYFRVSPPVVRQVILTLKARGFIDREPGVNVVTRHPPANAPVPPQVERFDSRRNCTRRTPFTASLASFFLLDFLLEFG